jgi:hypothetical protein
MGQVFIKLLAVDIDGDDHSTENDDAVITNVTPHEQVQVHHDISTCLLS